MSGILWTAFKIIIIAILVYWFFIEYIEYVPKNKQFIEKFSTQVADRILQKLSFHGKTEEDIKPIDLEKINKEREAEILGKPISNGKLNIVNSEEEIIEEEKSYQYYINTKLKTIPNQLPPILKIEDKDSLQENKIPLQTNYINKNYKLDDGILYNRNFESVESLSMYQELTLKQITSLINKVVAYNHKNTEDIKEEIGEYQKTIDTWKNEKNSKIFTSKIEKMKTLLMERRKAKADQDV